MQKHMVFILSLLRSSAVSSYTNSFFWISIFLKLNFKSSSTLEENFWKKKSFLKAVDLIPSWVPPKTAIMGANDSLCSDTRAWAHQGSMSASKSSTRLPILLFFLKNSQKSQQHSFLPTMDFKTLTKGKKSLSPLNYCFTPMACLPLEDKSNMWCRQGASI